MNTNRQSFKGESLAHGPMDTMSGKLTNVPVSDRAKVKPAPVVSKTSHVVYGVAVDTDDTKAAE
jgi:hypothetical protein